jgi:DHA1 family inner membrane transport protein
MRYKATPALPIMTRSTRRRDDTGYQLSHTTVLIRNARQGKAAVNMNTQSTSAPANRASVTLVVLFLAAFVVGGAELVVVGILPLIATGMAVSPSTAGALVTTYALGISIGGPLLTAATMKASRRSVLLGALAAYVVGNVLAAAAPTFPVLLAARVLTGALHGVLIGVAFAVAAAVVRPDKIGRAISVVFGGIAVSTALGVPVGSLVGERFGWRATFIAIVALGAATLAIAGAIIPAVANAGVGGIASQAKQALAPRVLAVLGLCLLVMGGQFAAFTYLAPYLQSVTRISGSVVSVFLFIYGVANAIGTFAGGWAADRNARLTLSLAMLILACALGTLYVAGSIPVVTALVLVLWGLVGFGLVPSLQYRVVSLAGPGRDLAATLPASAVTLGIAVGSIIGAKHSPPADHQRLC